MGHAAVTGQAVDESSVVSARGVAARSRVIPGDPLPVAVMIDIQSGWHLWPSRLQQESLPASYSRFEGAFVSSISLREPVPGVTVAPDFIQWPAYHAFKANIGDGPQDYAVFEGKVTAFVPVMIAADAAPGARVLKLMLSYQACDVDSCMAPADAEIDVPFEVVATAQAVQGGARSSNASTTDADPAIFAAFDPAVFGRVVSGANPGAAASSGANESLVPFGLFGLQFTIDARGVAGIGILLLLAMAGGFLLNLTPCVLPVIPLKIMGLTQMAGHRRRAIMLGLAMSAGLVAFWAALGVVMASIKSIDAVSALFQFPIITLLIGIFVALMALAMSGLFSVGLPNWVYAFEPKHDSMKGSFLVGIMTAILSTPCTGPFMGASIGFAKKIDSSWLLFGIFVTIGVGMSLPYMVLSAFPGLVKRVPRAGPASELVKQIMGLLLLAAAAYFIGAGLVGLTGSRSYQYWWIVAAISGGAGIWLMWRTFRITSSLQHRLVFGALGALILAISGAIGNTMAGQEDPLHWTLYSKEAESQARADGQVVVVKFTAHWCLSCKALEKLALSPPRIVDRLSQPDVKLLIVDITDGDAAQKARLREAGSATIPLLVVYGPGGTTLHSDAYTTQQVLDAVNAAAVPRPSMATR